MRKKTILKKVLSVMTALAMSFSVVTGTPFIMETDPLIAVTAEAEAAEINGVYQIASKEDLAWFADHVNEGNQSANAVLTADIDMSGVSWTTICETGLYYNSYGTDYGYSGTFDGGGHVISNLSVKSSTTRDASVGLFGTVSGTIKNLGMKNFTFVDGGKDVRAGAIAGQLITSGGEISNCYVDGAAIKTGDHVGGGIAGCVYEATIENCYAINTTVTGYSDRFGCVAGDLRADGSTTDRPGYVKNCFTDGSALVSSQKVDANLTGNKTGVTADTFASGEITYLLNGSSSENVVWYQTLGTDTYPVLDSTSGIVYAGYEQCKAVYANSADGLTAEAQPHNWNEGECSYCELICEHNYVAGVCTVCSMVWTSDITVKLDSGEEFAEGEYSYANGVHTINTDKKIKISGTTTTETVVIASGVSANITLAGVNIDVSKTEKACAFKIADNSTGEVTITLAEGKTNTLKSGKHCAGLQKNGTSGKLTIEGTGTLEATASDYGAGIGGGYNVVSSGITISGGTVTATGGKYGAGIGGGNHKAGSDITISGGTVTAQGNYGAGIGGGYEGTGSNITISGGTVTATSSYGGAGIGGGYDNIGSNITISGSTVTATGGHGGAGIGGGYYKAGSDIKIKGGSVKAVAGNYANAIGGGGSQSAVTPTNGSENVYLLEIDNRNDEKIYIDGKEFNPINHKDENKVYVYLTGEEHTVKLGENEAVTYKFIESIEKFVITADSDAMDFKVTGGEYGVDYAYIAEDTTLYIFTDTAVTIANKDGVSKTDDKIAVASGVSANITLAGVNIDVSGTNNACAFKIADDSIGNVTITLAEGKTNTLKSGKNCAGLQKNGTSGKLTIEGTGTLEATGGNSGAGIGGDNGGTGSGITIKSGTVTATGGTNGAGIGGSYGAGSNITISGGTVTATGGASGAGIGGGYYNAGSDITISGGTVTATGGSDGAGIGGGYKGAGSNITISGGSVKVIAGNNANAIGGGKDKSAVTPTNGSENGSEDVYLLEINNPNGERIYIDGKEFNPINHKEETKVYVYLTGEEHTVKLGENEAATYKFIESMEKFVTAANSDAMDFKVTGGEYGVDYAYIAEETTLYIFTDTAVTIANKDGVSTTDDKIVVVSGVNANITLAGVNIDVSGTEKACAFKIEDNSTGEVTITLAEGKTNTLKSGKNCAGLQKSGTSGKLTINGTGTLEATGGRLAAGIGGGNGGTGSGITIKSGTVTATGGYNAAGIGGGYFGGGSFGDGSNITISGGTVTATGGDSGAGIGGGYYKSGSDITISGGTVTATGGASSAGIGGGWSGTGSGITISGGTVTATGGSNGAGIGGGWGAPGSGITISGGSVKTVAGSDANAIGGGKSCSAVTPTNGSENGSEDVYLLEINNPNGEIIYIDGVEFTPVKHKDETKVYVYLTGTKVYAVKVGETETKYVYDSEQAKFVTAMSVSAEDFVFTAPDDLVYSGEAKTATVAVKDDVTGVGTITIKYFLVNEDGTLTAADEAVNVGTYQVKIDVASSVDGVGDYLGLTDSNWQFTIEQADISTANLTVTSENITYNGEEQKPAYTLKLGETTLTVGTDFTLEYSDNINAGTAKITATGCNNYKGTVSVEFEIAKADPEVTAPEAVLNLVYTGEEQALVTAGSASDGCTMEYSLDGDSYSTIIPTAKNAGTYTVYYRVLGNENYNGTDPESLNVIIRKADPTFTAPEAVSDLVYTGEAQALVTAGSVPDGCTMEYSLDGDEYSTEIPTAADAGNYIVYYRVIGDSNYYDTYPTSIEVTIAMADPILRAPEAVSGLVYTGGSRALVTAGSVPDVCTMEYSLDGIVYSPDIPTAVNAGTYTIYYRVLGNDNYNATDPVSIEVTIAKADITDYLFSFNVDGGSEYNNQAKTVIITADTDEITITKTNIFKDGEAVDEVREVGNYTFSINADGGNNYNSVTGLTSDIWIYTVTECEHAGGLATCSEKAVCDRCGDEYGELDEDNHVNIADEYSSDETGHWNECLDCGADLDKADHTGGEATCSEKAVCDYCGAEYGELDEDNHVNTANGWSSDETSHWLECFDCGKDLSKEDHTGGNATCTALAECGVCGAEYGELDEDNHLNVSKEWQTNETGHWNECLDCGADLDKADHTGGEATCSSWAKCEICGEEYGELAAHTWSDVWSNDETHHWFMCDLCNVAKEDCKDYAEHSFTLEIVSEDTLKSEATTESAAVYYKSCKCGAVSTTETFTDGEQISINAEASELTYNGEAQTPEFTVTYDGKTLTAGTDYTVTATAQTNAGDYTAQLKGVGEYTALDMTADWTIAPADIADTDYSCDGLFYNGTAQTIAGLAVETDFEELVEGEDFTIEVTSQTNAGNYPAVLTGKGNYTGTRELTWDIWAVQPVITITAPETAENGADVAVTAIAALEDGMVLDDMPAVKLTYKIGSDAERTVRNGVFTIPADTADGTVIVIKASTAASTNYEAAEETVTLTVVVCKHPNASAEWTTDETSHWHECPDCGGHADLASHISDEGTVTTEPTEESTGIKTFKCTECGYIMKEEIIEKLEHTHKPSEEWTSDATGHWNICTGCDSQVNYATHTEDMGTVTIEPTEEAEGERTYKCTVCGYTTRTEKIAKLEHVHTPSAEWTTDSTGHWNSCGGCDEKLNFSTHNEDEGTVIFEPDEETEGLKEYKCTDCGYTTRTETLAPTRHTHTQGSVLANDATGHWYDCSGCSEKLSYATHTEDAGTITTEPTETTEGERTYKCTVCGYVTRTEKIAKLAHVHELASEWSFDGTGHWYICSDCDEKVSFSTHTEDAGTITVEPTETAEGERTYKCTVCGYVTRTETVPVVKPDHTHSYGTEWTYNGSYHWFECGCGERSDEAAHISDNGTVENGSTVYRCTVCGYIMNTSSAGGNDTETDSGSNTGIPASVSHTDYVHVFPTVIAQRESLEAEAEIDGNSVTIKWNKISNAKTYTIYQKADGKYVKLDETDQTAYTISNLKKGQSYRFLIRYTSNGHESTDFYSDKINVTIRSEKPEVTAKADENSIKLVWVKLDGADRYAVYKYVNGKAVKLIETAKTAVRLTGLAPDTEYSYIVRARVNGEWTTMTKSDVIIVKTK